MAGLTTEEREEMQCALRELGEELAHMLEQTQEASRPVDLDQPIGRLSRMDAIQQQKMLQANRAAVQTRVQQVRSALQRLAGDDYGECLLCGEEIGLPRLKARPETPFCLECQSRREQST